jgi:hypothetical protein
MRMRKPNYLVSAILAAVLCIGGNIKAYSGDGDGSPENPYQISNIEDWQQLMATPDDWSSSFILTATVNLGGVTLTPVGNSSIQFTGVFDGNYNIISNAVINQSGSDYIGLFGYVVGGQIFNLGVEDVNMTGVGNVGGLVGYNDYGALSDCFTTGSVNGDGVVGGLVGWSSGTLSGCHAACSVSGTSNYVGGLLGRNYSGGMLSGCFATGSVSGIGRVGGLVGVNSFGTLTDCFATCSVIGTGNYVGGLAGYNDDGTITGCYATGSVNAIGNCQDTGGLVGYTYGGNISDCYATGPVSGKVGVGGLAGFNQGPLTNCYAIGLVTGTDGLGGIVGIRSNTVTACFWDIETTGIETSVGGTGITTAEMKTLSTFVREGWDFGTPVWVYYTNDYPRLAWEPTVPSGDLNHDKTVDFFDFAILASHWLE